VHLLRPWEVVGKNLFYFFGHSEGDRARVMHVHFGMAGRFQTFDALPGPDSTSTTRYGGAG
jgi:formamidopyrimidine-DNA glycosylase